MGAFHLGHQGPWDDGKSEHRLLGRGGRTPWGRGRGGRGSQERVRADGGALGVRGGSRPPDSRGRPRPWRRRLWSRTPRLLGDTATSDGGPRRPGMAAWSPAAAGPLLRGTRRVSVDGDRATRPGAGTALGPRGGPGLERRPAEGDAPGQGLRLLFLIH